MLRALSALPMLLAVLILRTDRRIVDELRRRRADSINSAVALAVPPVLGSWRLRRLSGAGAIIKIPPASYYLDEEGYAAFRKRRRWRAVLMLSIMLPLVFIIWWMWLQ